MRSDIFIFFRIPNGSRSFLLVLLLACALLAVPLPALVGEAARVPVDCPADCADVHGLVRLDLAPAELAVGNEGLVLVYFFGREVRERDGPAVADDELDLLPAAWACGMMAPPCGQAGHAELVTAFKPPEVLLGHCQANGAL